MTPDDELREIAGWDVVEPDRLRFPPTKDFVVCETTGRSFPKETRGKEGKKKEGWKVSVRNNHHHSRCQSLCIVLVYVDVR